MNDERPPVRPEYVTRIRQSFPDLKVDDLIGDNEGLVNDVVIVNGRRVFRFPKSEWAREALQQEARVLALARRYVTLPLPFYDLLEEDLASYELIPGEPLLQDDILRYDEATKDALAKTLATFLRQLHEIPRSELEENGVPVSVTVRSHQEWLTFHEDVQREIVPMLMSDSKEWVRRLFAPLLASDDFLAYEPRLVNGDLGPYHVLCDRQAGKINGIIDFGTAGLGDPAVDFGCLINNYGESFLARMARHYPAINEHLARARFRAGAVELWWVLNGLRSEDDSWFAVHIGRARDMRPIMSHPLTVG